MSKNKQIPDVGWALFVDSIGRKVEVDYPDDPDRESRELAKIREQDNAFIADNPKFILELASRSQPQSSKQPVPSNPSTFDKSALEYLDRYKTRGGGKTKRSPKAATFDKERQIVDLWRAYFGGTLMHEITVEDVNTAQREIEKLPAGRAQRGLS